MDQDNAFNRWGHPDRPRLRPDPGLCLRRLRDSYNAHINELFPRARCLVAYLVTAPGADASEELTKLRELAEDRGHFIGREVRDTLTCEPDERPGWLEVRRLIYCGFADGVVAPNQESVTKKFDLYEDQVRWFGERNALFLLDMQEAAGSKR